MAVKIKCRIASDTDYLSRVQLEEVADSFRKRCPKVAVELVLTDENLSRVNAKSYPNSPARHALLMTQLLEREYDALVLSASTLPPQLPEGITIGAITSRLTPYDVLISKDDCILDELPENSRIVANEPRIEAQILYYRPDLKIVRTRGSVDSLIQKVKSARVDGAILSAADVERLHKQDYVAEVFTNSICVPAAGQGSLAVLIRSAEEQIKRVVHALSDLASYSEVRAEWAFLDYLGVGENDPVGVLGSIEGRRLELEGVVALPDGREKIRLAARGVLGREVELGRILAEEILEAGGKEILQELNLI